MASLRGNGNSMGPVIFRDKAGQLLNPYWHWYL
jgi:hypothetical protein